MPERLFRDDGGAALERVAQLEDENRRLRAEVDRLTQGETQGETPVAGSSASFGPASRPAVVGVVTAGLAVAFASALSISTRHVHHDHARFRVREAMTPGVALAAPTVSPALPNVIQVGTRASAPTSECTYFDADGHKHYRLECLERGPRPPRPSRVIDRQDPWAAPVVAPQR